MCLISIKGPLRDCCCLSEDQELLLLGQGWGYSTFGRVRNLVDASGASRTRLRSAQPSVITADNPVAAAF